MRIQYPNELLHENVVVRTKYVGQGLRVSLVRSWAEPSGNTKDRVQAELVIEPGVRVILGRNGIRVEDITE